MVIPSGSLAVVLFYNMPGDIIDVASFSGWIFAPESAISSVYFLGELGGVPIILIKLILGVLILILFIVSPNRNSHPFSLPPSILF